MDKVSRMSLMVFATSLLFSLTGGGAHADTRTCFGYTSPPSVAGYYTDNFGGFQLISSSVWVSGAHGGDLVFSICAVNESEKYLVAQNDAAHISNPFEYSRFDWAEVDGKFSYCQTVYSAKTVFEAANLAQHPKADATDAKKGCGGFPWTHLMKK
jgi:hypothetical protein